MRGGSRGGLLCARPGADFRTVPANAIAPTRSRRERGSAGAFILVLSGRGRSGNRLRAQRPVELVCCGDCLDGRRSVSRAAVSKRTPSPSDPNSLGLSAARAQTVLPDLLLAQMQPSSGLIVLR